MSRNSTRTRAVMAVCIAIAAMLFALRENTMAQTVLRGINYQAAVRDSIGLPLGNREVSLRLSLLSGSSTGAMLYMETHRVKTDDLGLLIITIGEGDPVSGTFTSIDWNAGRIWLKVEMDVEGGSNFMELGSQQLQSVPFSLLAERARYADTAEFARHSLDGGGGSDSLSWSLNGNYATDPETHHIGTADSTDLVFRTNGEERLRIDADGTLRVAGLNGDGNRIVVSESEQGGALGSKTVMELIDSDVLNYLSLALSADTLFVNNLMDRMKLRLAHDSTFINELTGDSVFTLRVRDIIGDGLLRDSVFINTLSRHLDTLLSRDSVAISITQLVRELNTVLSRDSVFITSLTSDSLFIQRIRNVGDRYFWSLNGSRGTDPSRNFLGTTDNSALGIRTDNVERMRVASGTGNVGIGTSAPTEKLHVAGDVRVDNLAGESNRLMFADPSGRLRAGNNLGSIIVPQIDTLLARNSTFITAVVTSELFVTNLRAVGDTMFWSLNGSVGTNPSQNFLGTRDAQPLVVRTDNAERIRVDAGGNVGIGTAAPTERLHVAGNARVEGLSGTGTRLMVAGADGRISASNNLGPIIVPQIDTLLSKSPTFVTNITSSPQFITNIQAIGDTMFWSQRGSAGTNPARDFLGTRDAQPLVVRTDNAERVRVDAGGNVGIGTTAPTERLHVAGNARVEGLSGTGTRLMVAGADGRISASNNLGPIIVPQIDTLLSKSPSFITSIITSNLFTTNLRTIGDTMFWSLNGSVGTDPSRNFLGTRDAQPLALRTNNAERVRVDAGGNVGIGTAAPTERLHVAGNARLEGLSGTGTRLMVAGADGRISASSNLGPIIVPQIDTILANSPTFVNRITMSPQFVTNLQAIGDTMFWSQRGSVGTNPAEDFLGTRDAQPLSVRTNNVERVRVDATGNVGIGTSTPAEKLHVAGNARIDGLSGTGSRLMVAGANGSISATSNVGPIILPQIDTALANSSVFVTALTSNNSFTTSLTQNNNFIAGIRTIGDTMFWSLNGSVGTNPAEDFLGTRDAQPLSVRTNNVERVRVDATGNVGIGTSTPTEKLHVAGNVRAEGLSGAGPRLMVAGADGTISASSNLGPIIVPQIDTLLANNPTFVTNITSSPQFITNIQAIGDTMFWSLNGSVGTNPAEDFLGTRDAQPLVVRTDNMERVRVDATGNVGIGTSTPAEKLHVAGNVRAEGLSGAGPRLMVAGADGTISASSNLGPIIIPQIDTLLANNPTFVTNITSSPQFITNIQAIGDTMFWSLNGSVGTNPAEDFLGTRDAQPLVVRTDNMERVRVDATGNVGIGTSTPAEKLHVAGNARIDGLGGTGSRLMVAGADGSISATSNVGPIILPQIDTALANSSVFVTALTSNNSFTTSLTQNNNFIAGIRTIGDTMFWSLNGSVGTNPAEDFLGTRDAQPLVVRTDNTERVRVDATGNVGIGTSTPAEKLHVAGNVRAEGLSGAGPRLMVAGADGTISASSNLGPIIVPQIDTLLANNPTFVTNITSSPQFITNIQAIGDTMFWSLNGSVGTNPAEDFLGTRDAQPLVVRTDNTERVRVDATGNVGIGTSTPAEKLHVAGNARIDGLSGTGSRLLVAGAEGSISATSNVGPIILPQIDTALANSSVFVTALTSNNSFTTSLTQNNNFIAGIRTIGDTMFWSLNGSVGTNPAEDFLGTRDAQPLSVRTNNVERVRVDATGNVGIGTSSPTAMLHVTGSTRLEGLSGAGPRLLVAGIDGSLSASSDLGSIIVPQIDTILANSPTFINSVITSPQFVTNLRTVGDTMFWSLNGSVGTNPLNNFLGTRDAQPLAFRTNNIERLRIDASGNIGIGTSSPTAMLHVTGNARLEGLSGAGPRLLVAGVDGSLSASSDLGSIIVPQIDTILANSPTFINSVITSPQFVTNLRAVGDTMFWSLNGSVGTNPAEDFLGTRDAQPLSVRTNNVERVRVDATGNVGIGTSSPTAMLHVTGSTRLEGLSGAGPRLLVAGVDGSLSASSDLGSIIVPQIDTILANSPTFINSVITSPQFVTNLRTVGDTMFWSLNGSVGTNPLNNFLGTRDAQPLAFRTNNIERLRIDASGNVGIGTVTPGERLHLQDGNLFIGNTTNVAAEIRLQEPSGSGSNYVALRAPALDSNVVFQLPTGFGTANSILTSNGMGGLSWTNPSVLVGNSVWSVSGNAGLSTALFGTLDNVPIRFITGTGGPNERMRIEANGLIGIGTTTPRHRLHVSSDSTGDEAAGIYGVALQASANQAIGVWGDASNTGATNTGSIGVLATGNGNTAAANTNVALQVNDGGISVGRTTETGAGYSVVEGAAAGVSYTAQGPSGVIEVQNLASLLGLLSIGQSVVLNRVTIHNRYVTPNSIILVQVVSASGVTIGGLLNLTFSSLVDDRAQGSFKLSVSSHYAGLLPLTLNTSDAIRIGYVVINPGQ